MLVNATQLSCQMILRTANLAPRLTARCCHLASGESMALYRTIVRLKVFHCDDELWSPTTAVTDDVMSLLVGGQNVSAVMLQTDEHNYEQTNLQIS